MTQIYIGDKLREKLAVNTGRRKADNPDERDFRLARVRFYEGLFLGLLFSLFTLVYTLSQRCL